MMENYEPITRFDEDVAEIYDDVSYRGDTLATVAFLEQLAGGGPALELAIGTGRVALPLAARGMRVDGIDLSPAMVAQLRAKPGGIGTAFHKTMESFSTRPLRCGTPAEVAEDVRARFSAELAAQENEANQRPREWGLPRDHSRISHAARTAHCTVMRLTSDVDGRRPGHALRTMRQWSASARLSLAAKSRLTQRIPGGITSGLFLHRIIQRMYPAPRWYAGQMVLE